MPVMRVLGCSASRKVSASALWDPVVELTADLYLTSDVTTKFICSFLTYNPARTCHPQTATLQFMFSRCSISTTRTLSARPSCAVLLLLRKSPHEPVKGLLSSEFVGQKQLRKMSQRIVNGDGAAKLEQPLSEHMSDAMKERMQAIRSKGLSGRRLIVACDGIF